MVSVRCLVALALLPLAVGCSNAGRRPLPPPGTPPPVPEELVRDPLERYERLLPLRGVQVQSRYVPGSLDRAEHVRRRLEGICEALGKTAKPPLELRALVLDREGWSELVAGAADAPWGLPARIEPGTWAVAADADPDVVARVRELTGGWLPPIGGEPMRGTADEASALLVADALLQLEVVREYLDARGVRASEPWVGALFEQVAARLAWETTDPGQMAGVAALFDRFAAARPGPRRLADYREDLPRAEDLAFQADFVRGADVIWVEKGALGTRGLVKKAIQSDAPITAAELEDEFPELADWRRSTFAD
jgi:hypothetical protein